MLKFRFVLSKYECQLFYSLSVCVIIGYSVINAPPLFALDFFCLVISYTFIGTVSVKRNVWALWTVLLHKDFILGQ